MIELIPILLALSNSKIVRPFIDMIFTKMLGKSLTVIEAEQKIAAAKVLTRNELDKSTMELEKPYWEKMEQKTIQRKYENLGAILTKAAPHVTAPENPVADDNDFFWNFLEHCKDISNEQMQELLAKIVAGEYNAPQTHSVATLQALKSLDKKSITQFENMCCFLLNRYEIPVSFFTISDDMSARYTKFNTSYTVLQSLQSLGLVSTNKFSTQNTYTIGDVPIVVYFNAALLFERYQTAPNQKNAVLPAHYALSQVGIEIMQYLQPTFNPEYFYWLKQNYKIDGFKLIEQQ